jgi:hypothetical protein
MKNIIIARQKSKLNKNLKATKKANGSTNKKQIPPKLDDKEDQLLFLV